jgi:dihydrofolate reductase
MITHQRSRGAQDRANFFVSLDGVIESPEQWTFDYMNEEVGQAIGEGFASSDALLMGRVLYDQWAAHWPNSDQPMADLINNIPKYVVSTTLTAVDWNNSTLLNGNAREEIARLKEQPGKNIAMSGSATLAEWLLHEGLLDELRLMVNPVVVGRGRRLFADGKPKKALELADSKTYRTGVLDLTYRPTAG